MKPKIIQLCPTSTPLYSSYRVPEDEVKWTSPVLCLALVEIEDSFGDISRVIQTVEIEDGVITLTDDSSDFFHAYRTNPIPEED
jgi:hypothetical protein